MVIDKKIKNLILYVMHHENDIGDLIIEARYNPNIQRVMCGKNGFISNPTEQTAIRELTPLASIVILANSKWGRAFRLKSPETWLAMIDRIRMVYQNTIQGDIYRMKFDEKYTDKAIYEKLEISKQRYYELLNDIIRFAHGYGEGSNAIRRNKGNAKRLDGE